MARLRPGGAGAAFGFGVCALAVILGATVAAAQSSTDIFGAPDEWDPDNPPKLIKKPDFGNPAGSGAGSTGFISTNKPRKPRAKPNGAAPAPPQPAAAEARTAAAPLQQPQPPSSLVPMPPPSYAPAQPPSAAPEITGAIPPKRKPKPALDPYEPLGIRAGSFILRPAIALTGGFDSNPDRTPAGTGSSLYIVAPELKVQSDWERHELRADLRGTYTGYGSESSLNAPYFQSTVDGRIDWTRRTQIKLQNRFLLATDNPGSPNFQAGVAKPTIYTTFGGSAELVHQFNRLELSGKAGIDRTTYQDSKLVDGSSVNNDDRNLNDYALELRGSYELRPGVKPFVDVQGDRRLHDLEFDSLGVRRDSTGLSPRLGTSFELTRLLTGEVSVGYVQRHYQDPTLEDLSGPIAQGSLLWLATPLTSMKLTLNSTVYESTETNVSGVLSRDAGIEVDHAFRDWLVGGVKLGYGLDDYVGSPREDRRFSAGAELTYKMNRDVQLKGELRREQRRSNETGNDYDANIFLLTLRLQR